MHTSMYIPHTLIRVRRLYVHVKANDGEGKDIVGHFGKGMHDFDRTWYLDCILVPEEGYVPERHEEIGHEISEFCHGHVTVTVFATREEALNFALKNYFRDQREKDVVERVTAKELKRARELYSDTPFGVWKDGAWIPKWRWKCVSDLNCSVYV